MTTETTVQVRCDKCGEAHYHGPQSDRPQHLKATFWDMPGGFIPWIPEDLCKSCAKKFADLVRGWALPAEGGDEDD